MPVKDPTLTAILAEVKKISSKVSKIESRLSKVEKGITTIEKDVKKVLECVPYENAGEFKKLKKGGGYSSKLAVAAKSHS